MEKLTGSSLIAPCGINCGVCGGYLAYSRGIPRRRNVVTHCAGCRPRNKQCAFLKKRCPDLARRKVSYCFECQEFPCTRLERLDERYRRSFGVSPIGNLRLVQAKGARALLRRDTGKYRCTNCGGVRGMHNGVCYDCEKTRLSRMKRYLPTHEVPATPEERAGG